MVTEQLPWMQETASWLVKAISAGIPVLGICFGHQLLATALGGAVGWNPRGREIGTVPITLTPAGTDDPLLGILPATFPAHVTHRQSVLRLPDGARILASSDLEPHQAFAVGAKVWGVQFHPEFSAAAMHGYLDHFAGELTGEGFDLAALRGGVRETPQAASLLERFAKADRSA
jgi:GMP synthase (glutamine-hydrolysing)